VSESFSAHGAVDLAAMAAQRKAAEQVNTAAAGAPAGIVIDVTTATFERDVLERSMTVPVVLDLWAEWCGPCKSLSPVLEKLALEAGGTWVLAKVDVDAEQQIAAAFQVQSIPSVFAVIKGQPLPLFQGALPEAQIKQYIEALHAEAAKHGVTGRLGDGAPEATEVEAPEEVEDPAGVHLDAAFEAIEAADWDAAQRAYEAALEASPDDPDAAIGVKLVALYRRVDGADPLVVLQAAQESVEDVDLQLRAADVEALNQDWSAAFGRLVETVRRTSGEDRSAARGRLLELFDIAGPQEPAVAKGRVALANALF